MTATPATVRALDADTVIRRRCRADLIALAARLDDRSCYELRSIYTGLRDAGAVRWPERCVPGRHRLSNVVRGVALVADRAPMNRVGALSNLAQQHLNGTHR